MSKTTPHLIRSRSYQKTTSSMSKTLDHLEDNACPSTEVIL
jgi:hypothetical protein